MIFLMPNPRVFDFHDGGERYGGGKPTTVPVMAEGPAWG